MGKALDSPEVTIWKALSMVTVPVTPAAPDTLTVTSQVPGRRPCWVAVPVRVKVPFAALVVLNGAAAVQVVTLVAGAASTQALTVAPARAVSVVVSVVEIADQAMPRMVPNRVSLMVQAVMSPGCRARPARTVPVSAGC